MRIPRPQTISGCLNRLRNRFESPSPDAPPIPLPLTLKCPFSCPDFLSIELASFLCFPVIKATYSNYYADILVFVFIICIMLIINVLRFSFCFRELFATIDMCKHYRRRETQYSINRRQYTANQRYAPFTEECKFSRRYFLFYISDSGLAIYSSLSFTCIAIHFPLKV